MLGVGLEPPWLDEEPELPELDEELEPPDEPEPPELGLLPELELELEEAELLVVLSRTSAEPFIISSVNDILVILLTAPKSKGNNGITAKSNMTISGIITTKNN